MNKKYAALCFSMLLSALSIQNCLTDPGKNIKETKVNGQNEINESFRKTGWITDNKYRAVIFIITDDECKNSTQLEIEDKIKFEAFKNLQKELNPAFNRNASNQIKNLSDNFGKLIKGESGCVNGNIYFYDLEKKDLKIEFEKIKNL